MEPVPPPPSPERLRWQCRRGMLELDLLLQGFLDNGYERLSHREQACFVRMLKFGDQLLLDWMMGYVVPAEGEYLALIRKIRQAT